MSTEVIVEARGAVLVITINRPQARNAITRAVSELIAAALDRLDAEPALSVGILTGAAGNFSAGMDLKAFLRGERPEIPGRGLGGLTEAPPRKPLIAAVEGYALAGGCELVLACDLVVASETAQFGLTEVKRGLVAGAGGLLRLPQRIPRQIALEYVLTGKNLPASEAKHFGLVNRLVPEGQALEAAVALANEIAANAPLAVQMSKRIFAEAPGWDAQREMVDALLATNDAREGAAAFAEKRAPRWTGS